VIAGRDDLIDPYLNALNQELALLDGPIEVDTLFFGGGTPSHFSIEQLERLCCSVSAAAPLAHGGEWSVEANPSDLDSEKASFFVEQGVTRFSLGAQSFHAGKLQILERDHRASGVRAAHQAARNSGASVSLDLIFAAPGETLAQWKDDLKQAIELQPDHLSTYGLTYERGAAFYGRVHREELIPVDEEVEAQMYEAAIDLLCAAGYEHYEVSSFAKPGHRCRHNQAYWTGAEYLAFGPGAARYVAGRRETNHRSVLTWMRRLAAGKSPTEESEELNSEELARERLVFGLRRLEGIPLQGFAEQTGHTVQNLVGPALELFLNQGLLEVQSDYLRLTRKGLLVSDSLWPSFLE